MNIFRPEYSIGESVRALDDRRLLKQIIECKQLLKIALGLSNGYAQHPVALYYSYFPDYLALYGVRACSEYSMRFNKRHKDAGFFLVFTQSRFEKEINENTPNFYCEGPITDPAAIRTVENCEQLFRDKLIRKWETDKQPPKWTRCGPPSWYKERREK